MKKLLWLLPLFYCLGLIAQTTPKDYHFLNTGTLTDISAYELAFENNNLDRFRHLEHRITMRFSTGVEVELLSANELQDMGLPVDMKLVNSADINPNQQFQYILHPSGRIITTTNPVKTK